MEGTEPPRPDLSANLVPGRECGSCNVCCVSMTINEPTLRKPQGLRCRNAKRDNGCAIYANRPPTCREFYCGWRLLRWVKQPLRPDQSGILISLRGSMADGVRKLGIAVTILERRALKSEGLAETIAAAVNADIPTHLIVPGPPGYTSSSARIDEVLRPAVITRDKKALLEVLRAAMNQGTKGQRERITLEPEIHAPQDVAAPSPPTTDAPLSP